MVSRHIFRLDCLEGEFDSKNNIHPKTCERPRSTFQRTLLFVVVLSPPNLRHVTQSGTTHQKARLAATPWVAYLDNPRDRVPMAPNLSLCHPPCCSPGIMLMFRAILALALASSVSALAQREAHKTLASSVSALAQREAHKTRRGTRTRSPLTVPDTFQPKHTSLSPDSLKIVESSYGKMAGSEPYRPLYFVNSTRPLWM